ncbi:MAG: hypothetical protein ACHQYQ_00540 [Bacteriovoracales bacterium]
MNYSFKKLILFLLFLPFVEIYGAEFWLPLSMTVDATGQISHAFPLPTSFSDGAVSSEVSTGFTPVISGRFTNFKRIFAINPLGGDLNNTDESGIIIKADDKNGYRVVQQSDKALTLGASFSTGLSGWSMLSLELAIAGTIQAGYTSSRFSQDFQTAKKITPLSVPENPLILIKDWRMEDSLIFNRTFGLAFNASITSGPLAVGVAAIANSTWEVLIKKLDGNKVLLNYTKLKDKGVVFTGTAVLAGFSIEKIWGRSESFEYIFDLDVKKAAKEIKVAAEFTKGKKKEAVFNDVSVETAFMDALKGNLILADQLYRMGGFGVNKLTETVSNSKSKAKGAFFNVPFLINADYKVGTAYVVSQRRMYDDDTLGEELEGIYSRESTTSGLLSRDSKRVNLFTGNFQQITAANPLNEETTRRYSGNYKYLYMRNKVDAEKLELELKRVRFKIGQTKALKDLNIPVKEIGSLKIELDVTLSDLATDELIKYAMTTPLEIATKEATDYLEGYFANVKDANEEVCKDVGISIFKACYDYLKDKTIKGMKIALEALKEMGRTRLELNYEKFVKSYAEFGKGFIENRFTLKTFLRILKYDKPGPDDRRDQPKLTTDKKGNKLKVPFEVIFSMEGTNIKPFKKVLYTFQ